MTEIPCKLLVFQCEMGTIGMFIFLITKKITDSWKETASNLEVM